MNYYRKYIPEMAQKLNTVYKFQKNSSANQHYVRIEGNIWFSQQSSQWCLRVSTETSHSRKRALLNDGFQLQKCCICNHDSRQSGSKDTVKAEIIRPCGVWLKRLLPSATQKVHMFKRVFGNLHVNSRVCSHSVGSNKANNCSDRQQICQTFFPN